MFHVTAVLSIEQYGRVKTWHYNPKTNTKHNTHSKSIVCFVLNKFAASSATLLLVDEFAVFPVSGGLQDTVVPLILAEYQDIETDEHDGRRHGPDNEHQRERHDQWHPVSERAAQRGGEDPHGDLQPPPPPSLVAHGATARRRRRQPLDAADAPEERGEVGVREGHERQVVPCAVAVHLPPDQAAHEEDAQQQRRQCREAVEREHQWGPVVRRRVVGLVAARRRSGGWSTVTAISGSHGEDKITLADAQNAGEHKEPYEC